jgi:hypothetical protein
MEYRKQTDRIPHREQGPNQMRSRILLGFLQICFGQKRVSNTAQANVTKWQRTRFCDYKISVIVAWGFSSSDIA